MRSRSRRVMLLVGILAVGLASIAYAYWVLVPLPGAAGPSVSITSPPLQLSMGLDKTEYGAIDNLTVYFSLRNVSNKTVTVTEGAFYSLGFDSKYPVFRATTSAEGVTSSRDNAFHFHFSWVDSNGTVIYDTRDLFLYSAVTDVVLAPGGCLNQTLCISIPALFGIDGQSPK
ncbi:MAG: hypothetical protein WCC63_05345, partial [Candidatus Bathyarchaeia archaeon]